ncbi:MAG: gluconokinase [Acetobacteraceae bacterium]|nr:gluconokinase [Acetobacteraceae bacterium]
MGVSGSGKTTVAQGLAARLGWPVLEGDEFHPPANVAKMHAGMPLDDADRWPWLEAIAAAIDRTLAQNHSAIVTCSALKRAYRKVLIGNRTNVVLVYLRGTHDLIHGRMTRRTGHFMPSSLLPSQLATLEEPGPDEHPIVMDVDPPAEVIAQNIITAMKERGLLA